MGFDPYDDDEYRKTQIHNLVPPNFYDMRRKLNDRHRESMGKYRSDARKRPQDDEISQQKRQRSENDIKDFPVLQTPSFISKPSIVHTNDWKMLKNVVLAKV